jgi:hypothetical protein
MFKSWWKDTQEMNKILIVIFAIFSSSVFSQSKDVKIHSSSAVSNQARYEIIQSTLAARFTFKVDKVCGNIFQLTATKNDDLIWEQMLVVKLPNCTNDGKIRYQLFLSGLAARHTFLMNTDNGKTWQIRSFTNKSGNEDSAWFLLDD